MVWEARQIQTQEEHTQSLPQSPRVYLSRNDIISPVSYAAFTHSGEIEQTRIQDFGQDGGASGVLTPKGGPEPKICLK